MNTNTFNTPERLGKLEKVDIREIWKHEAKDFTTWLAKEENLTLLSDEIGISMNLISTEAGVGQFSADILAEEPNTSILAAMERRQHKWLSPFDILPKSSPNIPSKGTGHH